MTCFRGPKFVLESRQGWKSCLRCDGTITVQQHGAWEHLDFMHCVDAGWRINLWMRFDRGEWSGFLFFQSTGYIQACRALMISAVCLGFFGTMFALIGMECTKIGGSQRIKGRIACLAGVTFILSGECHNFDGMCLIPAIHVTWLEIFHIFWASSSFKNRMSINNQMHTRKTRLQYRHYACMNH